MSNALNERRIKRYVKLNPELDLNNPDVSIISLDTASKDLKIPMVDIMMCLKYGKIY